MEKLSPLFEAINKIAEGEVIVINITGDQPENYGYELRTLPLERFAGFLNKLGPEKFAGVASMADRPGAALFWTILEHTWFAPDGPDEKLYTCAWTRWRDVMWTLGFIPRSLAWTLEIAAQRSQMRIADGCPGVFDSDGFHRFPIPWIRVLENESNASIYQASEEVTRLGVQGCISPQEAIRRITTAERAMHREESEAIQQIYRDKGIDCDS